MARKWIWYSKELLVKIFNDEMDMGEAIFKATYLEDELKIENENEVPPAEILPLIGTEWKKEMNQGEGVRDQLVEMIAKLLWRA